MQFIAPDPGRIGPLAVLIDSIPASRADLARHLGVTPRTLAAWAATDLCPRSAKVAIFNESSYGRSQVNTAAHNDAALYFRLSESLRREVSMLQARIAYLERVGDFGAANAPSASAAAATAARAVALQVLP